MIRISFYWFKLLGGGRKKNSINFLLFSFLDLSLPWSSLPNQRADPLAEPLWRLRWRHNQANTRPRSVLGGSRLAAAARLPATPAPGRCSSRCRAARGSGGRCRGLRVCAGRAGRPRAPWPPPPPAPRPGPGPAAAPRCLRGGQWAVAAAAYVRRAAGGAGRGWGLGARSRPGRRARTDPCLDPPAPSPDSPGAQQREAMLMLDCNSEVRFGRVCLWFCLTGSPVAEVNEV